MSHTLTQLNENQVQYVKLVIQNYATGGEAVAISELGTDGALGVDGVMLATVPAGQNSLAVPLFPVLSAGKIVLFQFVGGTPTEIPPTTALNANVFGIVHVTGWGA